MAKSEKSERKTWKDIAQGGLATHRTRISRERQLRLFLRSLIVMSVMGILLTGVLAVKFFGERLRTVAVAQPAGQLDLEFTSDGVLTERWFRHEFGNYLNQDLRALNVHDIKAHVESVGQISHAAVSVSFPKLLRIQVQEREPVLRVRVRGPEGKATTLLIARDGHPYRGIGYAPETMRRIPGAAGLRLLKDSNGEYLPVEHLEEVAELMDRVAVLMPKVYRTWRIIHLDDWNPSMVYRPSLLRVDSTEYGQLTFSFVDVDEQLRRLGSILDHTERNRLGLPQAIDLSFSSESIVRYH